jgi:type IV secretion system protein VirB6
MKFDTFADFANQYASIFSAGTSNAVSAGLSAIAGPLTAVVVLWIIVQGILVMRGDVSVRAGITKILRVALVVSLLTSFGLFSTYVVSLFQTTLPNWAAHAITGSSGTANAPQMFDKVWNTSMAVAKAADAQLTTWDISDAVELALLEGGIGLCLILAFAVYEIGQIMLGVVIALGPFVIAGYLFDTTRGIADRWLGKLIGLSILTLLIAIALTIILQGDVTYIQAAAGTGALDVETSIAILMQAALFYALGALIIVLLPSIAAYIGGGISFHPYQMITLVSPVARSVGAMARSAPAMRRV